MKTKFIISKLFVFGLCLLIFEAPFKIASANTSLPVYLNERISGTPSNGILNVTYEPPYDTNYNGPSYANNVQVILAFESVLYSSPQLTAVITESFDSYNGNTTSRKTILHKIKLNCVNADGYCLGAFGPREQFKLADPNYNNLKHTIQLLNSNNQQILLSSEGNGVGEAHLVLPYSK